MTSATERGGEGSDNFWFLPNKMDAHACNVSCAFIPLGYLKICQNEDTQDNPRISDKYVYFCWSGKQFVSYLYRRKFQLAA